MTIEKKLEKIDRIKKQNSVFITEGKKDKNVLEKLGFKNIITISGKPLHLIPSMIHQNDSESVVILTDFDEEGEIKASQLTKLLEKEGFEIDHFVRKKFKNFGVYKIEELSRFIKFMEDDYHGETCSIYDKIFNRSRVHNRRHGRETRCDRSDIRPDRRTAGAGP